VSSINVELEECSARGVGVLGRRAIRGVLQAAMHRLERGERVGEIEIDELSLARFADQRLARQCARSHERTKRGFDRAPHVDQIGRQIFRAARRIEAGHGGAARIESDASAALCLRGHRGLTERSGGAPPLRCRG
jgi:hypothetical protein